MLCLPIFGKQQKFLSCWRSLSIVNERWCSCWYCQRPRLELGMPGRERTKTRTEKEVFFGVSRKVDKMRQCQRWRTENAGKKRKNYFRAQGQSNSNSNGKTIISKKRKKQKGVLHSFAHSQRSAGQEPTEPFNRYMLLASVLQKKLLSSCHLCCTSLILAVNVGMLTSGLLLTTVKLSGLVGHPYCTLLLQMILTNSLEKLIKWDSLIQSNKSMLQALAVVERGNTKQ